MQPLSLKLLASDHDFVACIEGYPCWMKTGMTAFFILTDAIVICNFHEGLGDNFFLVS